MMPLQPDPEYWHTQQNEARQILASCTAATWRPIVVWAIGALELHHAIDLYRVPLNVATVGPERHGVQLGRGTLREYLGRRAGWQVTQTVYGKERQARADVLVGDEWRHEQVVLAGRWSEVAALVTLDKIGATLHAQIVDACRVRCERTDRFDPTAKRVDPQSPEAVKRRELWAEIERHCYYLAALAWRRCRPMPVAVPLQTTQLSLFDLAA